MYIALIRCNVFVTVKAVSKQKRKSDNMSDKQVKAVHPLKAIRRAGVPLVAYETQDPAATVAGCRKAMNGGAFPIMAWDVLNGLHGLNDMGKETVTQLVGEEYGMPLPGLLSKLKDCPAGSLVFLHQCHRFLEWEGVLQGIWNLRDSFKGKSPDAATLVLLGFDWAKLPGEIRQDVITVIEPVPGRVEIESQAKEMIGAMREAGANIPADYDQSKAVDGLMGLLSMFDVEQTLALNLSKEGVNVPGIWERKIKRLKGSTGADIAINNPTFADLSGCENVKDELRAFINGRQRPGVVLFMDEIEKMFSGAGTDLSGTTTNMLGQFLTWTQEKRARGFLLAGIPGAGKTWTATCAAGEAGVPLFKLNISEAKGSLVGQSEQQMKASLAAVDALAGDGSVLLIASCNWVDQLTPDVMARFTMGTFFYDFPDEEERAALLNQYFDKYALSLSPTSAELASTKGWVGREIENACFKVWQFKRSFSDVGANIAPSSISQRAKLEKLRKDCSERFLSASKPGLFRASEEVKAVEPGKRQVQL